MRHGVRRSRSARSTRTAISLRGRLGTYTQPTYSCTKPNAATALNGVGTAQGAQFSWQPPPNAQAQHVTYDLQVTGPKTFSNANFSGTSVMVPQIWQNGMYSITVTAHNVAGAQATSVSRTSRARSSTTSASTPATRVTRASCTDGEQRPNEQLITNYNGQCLQVDCQMIGANFTHTGGDPHYSGDLWDYVHYQGKDGFIIGYLMRDTAAAGLAAATLACRLWECAG